MHGQWNGYYQGTNAGSISVNIDEMLQTYKGVAYVNEQNPALPKTAAFFETPTKANQQTFTAFIQPVHPITGIVDSWENIKPHYANNVTVPTSAKVDIKHTKNFLYLKWSTNIGTHGGCKLPKTQAPLPSNVSSTKMDWATFKSEVEKLDSSRPYIFRGQSDQWRLRTAFHRRGRADLNRFIHEDIPTLHRNLSLRTTHLFDLTVPDQNGAFLNLVQHHGYPTPLLDWTYSPYVAAFFAFSDVEKIKAEKATEDECIRIYVFHQKLWCEKFQQVKQLLISSPHFSILEFLSTNNERMVPQQAISSVTNMDDIESYILSKQQQGDIFLTAIDIPKRERSKAMTELQYMGITAASLFPGLDGTCADLRERNFRS
jgi:FRG domain